MEYALEFHREHLDPVKSSLNTVVSNIETLKSVLEGQINAVAAYASKPPAVSFDASAYTSVLNSNIAAVSSAVSDACSRLDSIASAVEDYADGVWNDPSSKIVIDDFLGIKKPSGGGGSSGDGGGGGAAMGSAVNEILELDPNEEIVGTNGNVVNEYSSAVGNDINSLDEDLILPTASEEISGGFSSATSNTSISSDEDLTSSSSLSDIASSAGNSGFQYTIPSLLPTGTIGSVDGQKSAGVIGAIGIAAAAAAALGGKVYYDTKNEEEAVDDSGEFMDDSLYEDDTDAADVNVDDVYNDTNAEETGEMFSSDSLKLKQAIFNIGGEE